MHVVALLSQDMLLSQALSDFRDEALHVYLHPIPPGRDLVRVLESLEPIDFVGALILDELSQTKAYQTAQRSSLDAQQVEAADTVTVTAGGLIAEYNFGRAIGSALRHAEWDPRGASAVVLGANINARAVCRELSSLGLKQLTVLANNRPLAEQTAAGLAASTEIFASAQNDPLAQSMIENADLLVRVDPKLSFISDWLGPHLTVVDLAPQTMSSLRQQALEAGALAIGLRDVQAHQIALALNHILGARFEAGGFLELLLGIE